MDAVEEAVERREVPHPDVGAQPVRPRSLLGLDAPQPIEPCCGGHDQAGPPMARVAHVAVRPAAPAGLSSFDIRY